MSPACCVRALREGGKEQCVSRPGLWCEKFLVQLTNMSDIRAFQSIIGIDMWARCTLMVSTCLKTGLREILLLFVSLGVITTVMMYLVKTLNVDIFNSWKKNLLQFQLCTGFLRAGHN